MAGCPDLPPIVWKSDFHGTREAFALLDGVVDVYLADFKFGDDAAPGGSRASKTTWQIVTRNLLTAAARAT